MKTKKSTDAPWMNDFVLKRIKARKKVYRKAKKNNNWKTRKKGN